MTNYVIDLFNRSIGGGRVLPENEELPEPLKTGKKTVRGCRRSRNRPSPREKKASR